MGEGRNWGSIQENRHKMEQFHLCGTVYQKCGIAPQKVEQVLIAGHCSTNCGTVPQFVERLLLKVEQVQLTVTTVTTNMLFQDVEQCTTLNCVSHRSISSQKLLFRMNVLC